MTVSITITTPNLGGLSYAIIITVTKIQRPQYEEIAHSYQNGVPVQKLADAYCVNKVTIYRILKNKCKINIGNPHHVDKGSRDRMIVDHYLAGLSVTEIAERFNLSTPSIYRIIALYKKSCIRK